MNIWDIVISAVILAVLALAVTLGAKRKKSGGCGCGSSDCASCGTPCSRQEEND